MKMNMASCTAQSINKLRDRLSSAAARANHCMDVAISSQPTASGLFGQFHGFHSQKWTPVHSILPEIACHALALEEANDHFMVTHLCQRGDDSTEARYMLDI